jgi:hypothetical protein
VRAGLLGLAAVLLASRDLLGFLALAAVAVVSLYAAPRTKTDRRWLWFSLPASALAVSVLFSVVEVASDQLRFGGAALQSYSPPVMREYENIYVRDENGKLLTNVLLYDQDGKPINAAERHFGCRDSGDEPMIPANQYPRPKIDYENGVCYTVRPSADAPSSAPSSTGSSAPPPSSGAPSSSVAPTSVSPSK